MRRFRDWPIAVKLAVAPAAGVLLMVALLLGVDTTMSRLLRHSTFTVEEGIQANTKLLGFIAEFRDVNGQLHALMTKKSAGKENIDYDAKLRDLGARTDALIASVTEFAKARTDKKEAEQFEVVINGLTEFKGAVDWVSSMLQVDFNSAVSFLEPFEEKATDISTRLGNVVSSSISAIEASTDRQTASVENTRLFFLIGTALAAVLLSAVTVLLIRTMNQSINGIAGATLRLAQGDEKVALEPLERGDELGTIVKSLHVFKENTLKIARMQREQEELRQQAEADRIRTRNEMADQFERKVRSVVERLSSIARDVRRSAGDFVASATTGGQQSKTVGTSSYETHTFVEGAAAAATELASSIEEIARQMQYSANISNQVVEEIDGANSQITILVNLSQRIGDVARLIADIAGQTNLLALNATIEAARAGEAGKGFAVVASEVKQLATQTSNATVAIADQIREIQAATNVVAHSMGVVGSTIQKMNEITNTVAATVEEQNAATQEIVRSVQTASDRAQLSLSAAKTLDTAIDQINQGAGALQQTAETLNNQGQLLEETVDSFVKEMRAA